MRHVIRSIAALVLTVLFATLALPTSAATMAPDAATETPDLSVCRDVCTAAMRSCKSVCASGSTEPMCRVPCPTQYVRCVENCSARRPVTTACAEPQEDTCELRCNQGEDACRRVRPAETCSKEADECRKRCASYGPDPLPW